VSTQHKLNQIFLFSSSLLLICLLFILSINVFNPKDASAQISEPELVLFLAASSSNPFQDLSSFNHTVVKIQNGLGGSVQVVYDSELDRNVFSFINGSYLEILDEYEKLKLTSADEMTIEINVKIVDQDPGYHCGEQQLPITQPIPDQMIFCKGPIYGYPRNYALGFGWGRDDMRLECCDPFGYFPGYCFGIGGITHGYDSPMNTSELIGWRIYSFLISKISESEIIVRCYTNRNDMPYPANFPIDGYFGVDNQANTLPLIIGNGYATSGTNNFQPNPFYGFIDYIRIYKGLLPVEELNDSPFNDVPFPPANQPPVAMCKDIKITADENCQASIIPENVDGGSYDPDGDIISLSIDNSGPFSLGEHYVNLTITDENEASDMCQAKVTVVDITSPEILVTDPVCVNVGKGKGKMANKLIVNATDNCGMENLTIEVEIFNNGGQLVKGEGVYKIIGNEIFAYPNGEGWSICVTATAIDEKGNTTTKYDCKSLLKCKK
jgi:hypothetical protein